MIGTDQDTSATTSQRLAVQAKAKESTQVDQEGQEDDELLASERLWSNLNAESLKHEPGSILGSIALLAGTTVGAGILALPAVTQESGYIPSTAVILGCWLYSVVTGLLVAETNVRLMCELGRGGVSVLSMAKDTYGKPGGVLAGSTYVFLHYCLLVAYVARGGELLTEFIETSPTMASVAFSLLLGTTIYVSESKVLDSINTSLVVGIVVTFVGILGMALTNFDPSRLTEGDTSKAVFCVPVVALAFVYHNVIPVVASNLEGDRKKITTAILAGTSIPLAMFLLWNLAILGYKVGAVEVVDTGTGTGTGSEMEQAVMDPLKLLQADPTVGAYISVFSLLAIATSFIGFVLGLTDFIGDALKLPTNSRSIWPFSLTLIPPTLFALLKPDIFMDALGYAGTYGVLLLFWVLPSGMAWQTRRREDLKPLVPDMVPGGSIVLLLTSGSAMAIMLQQTLINVGVLSK